MAKGKRRDSFVYHLAWEDVLDNLPEEVREEVRGAIIGYARTGVTPELKPLAAVAFAFVRRDMDWDIRKYEDMVSARSESGRKGGSARQREQGEQNKQSQANEAKQANASFAKQNKQSQANEAIYEYDYEYDYVPQDVCGDSAHACAEGVDASTPHTQPDFFFMTFWERNIHSPHKEAQRFTDFYEAAGWTMEKGGVLDTDAKRLAKARNWKPETAGDRFPAGFIPAWKELAEGAPEDVRARMYDDKVAVKTSGNTVTALVCHESVKRWMMTDGVEAAKELLIGRWLDGYGGKTLRIMTYKN